MTGTSLPAPLYAPRKKIYPAAVHGRFRRIKWGLLVVTLGIYYLLPFLRWDRGPNAPDQAVLLDLPARRFYFFFIEIWPQEFYYVTGLLVLAAMVLFLMNAVAGRIWCGYLCPQTVWTDLFLAVERRIEGDRRAQMRAAGGGWSAERLARAILKHGAWLAIAWWTGGAWVLYFADAPTLVHQLATFQAPFAAWLWIGILTFTTYLLAGHAREQVCTYMCPWPRIQASLIDKEALNITYRYDRGEPRLSLKKAEQARAAGAPAGDCVDCGQCVAVCPTGVDIRNGLQLSCIQCGLCIDACDAVMTRIGRPPGLIAYDSDLAVRRRQQGLPTRIRPVRPRTILYAAMIAVVGSAMLARLLTRPDLGLHVAHERNPLSVTLSDGAVRNAYAVRFINKQHRSRRLDLSLEGIPGARLALAGDPVGEALAREIGPDRTEEVRVLVTVPPPGTAAASTPLTFVLRDPASGAEARLADQFSTRR
ncbi:cytochrome c oxidase accessory protein CcoG [Methylobacterium sp. 4-46]|uniref:cytochrome c oxidase accessory protein CcoG n=1 Tax=unclassified Methylobacterium TaxID=2615210 RepID=UPI000165C5C5|nr:MULTISPECIES: cytochrome c oxidase accessory protein CcoG [Methylobacterium]ACA14882.1 cytochrome c oxidase accessory protein CcoG [Methylobacterium sp. 4-46]WFT80622.1 cytochrome c oxidase accessory protein CcoG [Methylobacterium nodulans]